MNIVKNVMCMFMLLVSTRGVAMHFGDYAEESLFFNAVTRGGTMTLDEGEQAWVHGTAPAAVPMQDVPASSSAVTQAASASAGVPVYSFLREKEMSGDAVVHYAAFNGTAQDFHTALRYEECSIAMLKRMVDLLGVRNQAGTAVGVLAREKLQALQAKVASSGDWTLDLDDDELMDAQLAVDVDDATDEGSEEYIARYQKLQDERAQERQALEHRLLQNQKK